MTLIRVTDVHMVSWEHTKCDRPRNTFKMYTSYILQSEHSIYVTVVILTSLKSIIKGIKYNCGIYMTLDA